MASRVVNAIVFLSLALICSFCFILDHGNTQCCHSKKIENPRLGNKKTKKTQGQISIRFRKISGKNRTTFSEKSKLFLKKCLFSAKIFFVVFFFLVIASDFQIFYPDFSNFDHFSPNMSYFLQKTTKKCIFRLILQKPKKNP